MDESLKNEFLTYMQLLREGRGILGKLARQHHKENPTDAADNVLEPQHVVAGENGVLEHREVLHHLYNITGRSKVARVTKMLQSWLADPTKGKLCIFAHHLDVLNQISSGAELSNAPNSSTKYIRIDGSTSPRARQEQILKFQTDPAVRVAMLGITAAGVAVTLTASSTVWFTELFWTPAIMIQAEDRW
jgi:SNF2 family DNA or RNA helicase